MFAIPVFLAPILVDLAVGWIRKKSSYRANDLITNLSLSMLSTLVSVIAAIVTLGIYVYLYNEYALFEFRSGRTLNWLFAVVAYDFLYYWTHRAHHRIAMLWAVHVVHHSGEDMNFGLSLRQSVFSEFTMWIFFLPMALLGIAPEIYLGVTALQLIYQYSIHNTYVGHLGWLEKILVTPSQHRVHHGWNRLYIDKNFGNVLVLWDRLFGTYQPEMSTDPVVYGLRDAVKSWNPLTINFHYLQKLASKVRFSRGVDRVLALIKEPDWQPAYLPTGSLRQGDKDVSPVAWSKYDAKIAPTISGYCLFQFLMTFILLVALLGTIENIKSGEIVISAGFLFWTAFAMGALLDGRAWFWYAEIFRWVALSCLFFGGVLLGQQPAIELAVFLGLYCGISLLYLSCFRLKFPRTTHYQLSN